MVGNRDEEPEMSDDFAWQREDTPVAEDASDRLYFGLVTGLMGSVALLAVFALLKVLGFL